MKKLMVGLALAGVITAAFACTTQTVMTPNGAQTCTTCCTAGGNCNTTCF